MRQFSQETLGRSPFQEPERPQSPSNRKMARKDRVVAACLMAGLAVLAASCGGLSIGSAGRTTVRVDLADAGRTFTLAPGDHLLITLSSGKGFRAVEWRLVSHPKQVLELLASDPDRGRFEFVARGSGGGEVQVNSKPRCEGPLPAAMVDRCPLGRSGQQATTASGAIPVRLFSITVRVG